MASPQEIAGEAMAALHDVHPRLCDAVMDISDRQMAQPSALPDWRRAHLVSHLGRNADALVNLLNWARTEVEQPAYASDEDRDADIFEGARRMPQVIREDFLAASGRFLAAAERMPASAWSGSVTNRQGNEIGAHLIPWMRVMESLVHLVDLDVGVGFADLADVRPQVLERVLEVVVGSYRIIDGTPPLVIHVDFGDFRRDYALGEAPAVGEVSGSATELLGWLSGRTDGAELVGDVPELPGWLR
jgi:maleylpyruvate isomerase